MKFSIKNKLIFGFSSIFCIFVVTVLLTASEISNTMKYTNSLMSKEFPLVERIQSINVNLQRSLANLRGWMLTGNEQYKAQRSASWEKINYDVGKINSIFSNMKIRGSDAQWNKLKILLVELRKYQNNIENIARSDKQIPALNFYKNHLLLMYDDFYSAITNMINYERSFKSSVGRKELIVYMADFRGTISRINGMINYYVITGDEKFLNKIDNYMVMNKESLIALKKMSDKLTSDQKIQFSEILKLDKVYKSGIKKVITLRQQKNWDLANHLLVTKASPVAYEVESILGTIGDSLSGGSGLSGMVNKLFSDNTAALNRDLKGLMISQWFLMVMGVLLIILITWLTSRSIVKPIYRSVEIANRIKAGERNIDIDITTNDETTILLKALKEMNDSINKSESELKNSEEKVQIILSDLKQRIAEYRVLIEQVKDGDLRKRIEIKGDDELAKLGDHLNQMTNSLGEISQQIKNSSYTLSSGISELESTANSQVSSAAQQASSVAEMSNVIEEIKATSAQTMDRATKLGSSAEKIQKEGEKGKEAVLQTIKKMENLKDKVDKIANTIIGLSEKTQQIGEITETVGDLSKQSKLLALNAAIEAAKAGDAGRGFAVVAGEVKTLADQSQQSTERVKKILQDISDAAEKAVMVTEEGSKSVISNMTQVQTTRDLINDLVKVIEESSIASQQIVAAVREESAGVDQMATSILEINKVTQQFKLASEQTQQTVVDLSEVARGLRMSMSVYKIENKAGDHGTGS